MRKRETVRRRSNCRTSILYMCRLMWGHWLRMPRTHSRERFLFFFFSFFVCAYIKLYRHLNRRHRQRTSQRRPSLTYTFKLFYFSILRFRQLQFTTASSPSPPLPLLLLLFYFSIVCTVFDMTHFAGTTTKTKIQDCDHCNYVCDRQQLCTLELLL